MTHPGAPKNIVVASPSLPVKVRFHLESGPLEAVVSPTYVSSAGGLWCLARGLY